MRKPNNKVATNARQTNDDVAHPYANWLTRNLAIITILLTMFGFFTSGAVGIWYASGAYHNIITSIESLQIDAMENNKSIRDDIKRIDTRLDGMDRRLSTIEGKISSLSKDKNAPKKAIYPIIH